MEGLTAKQRAEWCAYDEPVARLLGQMRVHFPKLRIVFKDDSRVYRWLNRVIPSRVLYRMSTTLFNIIAIGSREKAEDSQRWYFRVLAHEFVHLFQFRRAVRFIGTYLAPQLFLLVGFAAAAVLTWGLGMVSLSRWLTVIWVLATLAPWPSPGRLRVEIDAYTMNLAVQYWREGRIRDDYVVSRAALITSWRYWKMAWWRQSVERTLFKRTKIIANAPLALHNISPAFDVVHRILRGTPLGGDEERLEERVRKYVASFSSELVDLDVTPDKRCVHGLYIVKEDEDA